MQAGSISFFSDREIYASFYISDENDASWIKIEDEPFGPAIYIHVPQKHAQRYRKAVEAFNAVLTAELERAA
jgi:hypothetical protein